jgi:hypothetical protein
MTTTRRTWTRRMTAARMVLGDIWWTIRSARSTLGGITATDAPRKDFGFGMLPQPPSYGSSARSTDNQMRNAAYSMIALMDRCQAVVKYRPNLSICSFPRIVRDYTIALMDRCQAVVKYRPNLSICSFPRVVRSVHNREYSASANLV